MDKYYAVKVGRKTGIYKTWEECRLNVINFPNATFKSFKTEQEAESFIRNKKTIEQEQILNTDSKAIAYVDGSYNVVNNKYSYGVIIFYNGEEKQFKKAFSDKEMATMRNVAGEIMGAKKAMKFCIENNIKNIDIYYDYEGIEKWCTGIWKANKEGTKKYKSYYDSIKNKLNIHFFKVKGHSGNKYNELVDKLAKSAVGII